MLSLRWPTASSARRMTGTRKRSARLKARMVSVYISATDQGERTMIS